MRVEVRLIVVVRTVVSEPVPTVVTKAVSLVNTVILADVFTLTEALGLSLAAWLDDPGTSFPTFPDASGVSLGALLDDPGTSFPPFPDPSGFSLSGISGFAGFDDSVGLVPRGAVPPGPWLVFPEFTAVGYGGPRGPVPRGTEMDGNCTVLETELGMEEPESAVLAVEA